MGLFSSQKFETLDDLFLEQIEDIYDAEKRLCDALPKMADAATNTELANAFRQHLAETKTHVRRLDDVFRILGKDPERETCDAMKELISEGQDMMESKGSDAVRDAALIAAAQRVEHYEIAAYGTARNFALQLGHEDIAGILQETLDEEGATDKKLTQIAVSVVNPSARQER